MTVNINTMVNNVRFSNSNRFSKSTNPTAAATHPARTSKVHAAAT